MNAHGDITKVRPSRGICVIKKNVAVSRKGYGVLVAGAAGVQLMPSLIVVPTFRDLSFDAAVKPVIFSLQ